MNPVHATAATLIACAAFSPAAAFDLARDNQPASVIVVPGQPTALQTAAANLLVETVKAASGAELQVFTENAAPAGPKVFIGPTRAAQEAGLDASNLIADSYRLRVLGDSLFILGRDTIDEPATGRGARGTLKATLDTLQEFVGARRLVPAPEGTFIPKRDTITLPDDLDRTHEPNLLCAYTRFDRFYPWSLANGARQPLKQFSAGGHTWSHAFPDLEDLRSQSNIANQIDAAIDVFAASHPDLFAMHEGRRMNVGIDLSQGRARNGRRVYNPMLCTSHPDFVPMMTGWMQGMFDRGYDLVQLGESDGLIYCECDRCNERFGVIPPTPAELGPNATPEEAAAAAQIQHRIDEARGKRVFLPHKAVVEACYASHPSKYAVLLVYAGARPYLTSAQDSGLHFPPNTLAEATNAAVDQLDPLKAAFPNEEAFGRFWGVTLYTYWMSPWHGGLSPTQTPASIAAQTKKVLDYKMFGIYFYGGTENFPAMGPVYYVTLRTLEDPARSPESLVAEYCEGLYGRAADTMVKYYDALYEKVDDDVQASDSGTPGLNRFARLMGVDGSDAALRLTRHRMKYLYCWPAPKLDQLRSLLDQAETQAAGDERSLNFIRLARIGYEQVAHTATVFQLWDEYERTLSPDLAERVQTALGEREAWIAEITALKDTDPAFVASYFPNYAVFCDHLATENCKQSPLNKPFTGVDFNAILGVP